MKKDFDTWNHQKKIIETNTHRIIHEGEIWWCSIGLNIGHEQDGRNFAFERPVLIIRKFNNQIVWGVPISTQVKRGVY